MRDDNEPTRYDGGNRLVDGLPPADRDEVVRGLTVMTAEEGSDGIVRGERITAAYFPIDAIFSVLVELEGGHCYEVDSVGRDSAVGIELLLGAELASRSAMCQIGGRFARMPLERFRDHLVEMPSFAAAVHRTLLMQWFRSQQTIACNFAHAPVERCARWAMMTHDAIGREEFSFRAEYLAMMLGLQTHAVIEPMAALQALGAIRYADDVLTIVSERRLRQSVCECYGAPFEYGRRLAARRDGRPAAS